MRSLDGAHTYPVRQEEVPSGNSDAGRIRYTRPAVRLLRKSTIRVMIPVEGHERRQLHSTVAQLIGVPIYVDR